MLNIIIANLAKIISKPSESVFYRNCRAQRAPEGNFYNRAPGTPRLGVKNIFRHFEEWTFSGSNPTIKQWSATLYYYNMYPELFLTSDDRFCL